jgi:hypothetical protein
VEIEQVRGKKQRGTFVLRVEKQGGIKRKKRGEERKAGDFFKKEGKQTRDWRGEKIERKGT